MHSFSLACTGSEATLDDCVTAPVLNHEHCDTPWLVRCTSHSSGAVDTESDGGNPELLGDAYLHRTGDTTTGEVDFPVRAAHYRPTRHTVQMSNSEFERQASEPIVRSGRQGVPDHVAGNAFEPVVYKEASDMHDARLLWVLNGANVLVRKRESSSTASLCLP